MIDIAELFSRGFRFCLETEITPAPTMTTMSPAIKEVMATRCMRSIMGGGTGRPRDHAPRAIGIWQVAQLLGKDNASNRASARS